MNDTEIKERLSALLDGELPRQEMPAMLDRLARDAELQRLWDHYQLIGDTLRGEEMRLRPEGVAAAVAARIAEEPAILAPAALTPQHHHWARNTAAAAIAASVAVLAVLWMPGIIGGGDKETQAPLPALAVQEPAQAAIPDLGPATAPVLPVRQRVGEPSAPLAVVETVSQRVPAAAIRAAVKSAAPLPVEQLYERDGGTRWSVAEPEVEQRLNDFLIGHQKYAPVTHITGMLPYATVVGYDSRQ